MSLKIEDRHWQNGSFTVGFSFSNGNAYCEGFKMETVVSDALRLKYRLLAKHPEDGRFWTLKHMEEPLRQDEIEKVLEEIHRGYIASTEFAFEVFDESGKEKLFSTKFNAAERIPANGYGSEHIVFQSFTWSYPLPPKLQEVAKKALEDYVAGVSHNRAELQESSTVPSSTPHSPAH